MRLLIVSFLYWKCPFLVYYCGDIYIADVQCIRILSISFLTNCLLASFSSLIPTNVTVAMCESLFCVHKSINQSYSHLACLLFFRKKLAINHLFICPVLPSDHFCACFQCISSSFLILILTLAFLRWDAFPKVGSITFLPYLQGTYSSPHLSNIHVFDLSILEHTALWKTLSCDKS